jgi:glycogen debranching enzyme
VLFTVDLMNADVWHSNEVIIPRGSVHLQRSKVLWQATCFERLRAVNYSHAAIDVVFSVQFGADFADLFEVRGTPRQRRGRLLPPRSNAGRLVLEYEGLDGRRRRTRIALDPVPEWSGDGEALFSRAHRAAGRSDVALDDRLRGGSAGRDRERRAQRPEPSKPPSEQASHALEESKRSEPHLHTSNTQFNHWINRSRADIHLLWTDTPQGPYPYAGVPWYSTVFGRDGIITALECLWMNPALARGVLSCLAHTQATACMSSRTPSPGKIIHEIRSARWRRWARFPSAATTGRSTRRRFSSCSRTRTSSARRRSSSCASSGRMSSARSNGSTDTAILTATASSNTRAATTRAVAPGLEGLARLGVPRRRAQARRSDSRCARCRAMCMRRSSRRAPRRSLGHSPRAEALVSEAEQLRERFEDAFWCEDLSTYALALDGRKRPCRVRASNAGMPVRRHRERGRAARLAKTLLAPASFSGWGIRTVAMTRARYNPMSYHNGSVWPHDNALIAAGSRATADKTPRSHLTGLFDAALCVELHRLPELFCGFRRRPGESPTMYPVACSPQAWAAGAVFLCLQACLGLEVRYPNPTVTFSNPMLPSFLDAIQIHDLKVGNAAVDLVLTRHAGDVGISVRQRSGHVSVVTLR